MSAAAPQLSRILVVDDDPAILEEYVRALRDAGLSDSSIALLNLERDLFGARARAAPPREFEVSVRDQGEAAVNAVQRAAEEERPYAVVFLDVTMPPGICGMEVARRMRAIDPVLNIVIVTGSASVDPERLVTDIGRMDHLFFFQKPFHEVECRQLAAALCSKWQADRALVQAHEVLEKRVEERTAELHELAYYDETTGLPNRNKLLRELDNLIAGARQQDRMVAVLLLDIDRFSFINETMGYEAGTELLNLVAHRLDDTVRGQDVAGRFGSDEFACLIGNISGHRGLQQVVKRVEDVFSKPFRIHLRELFVRACLGVAAYPLHGSEAHEVVRCAEAALNRSKRHVIHETIYYDREMGEFARRQLSLEAKLRRAIAEGDIQPRFQPQICLRSGAIVGAEALACWTHPDGRVVSPAEFVPLAEEVGLSDALFESMLKQSLAAVGQWLSSVGEVLPVSINISAHQLRNPNLIVLIRALLEDQRLAPELLKLELTETVLMEDLDVAQRFLETVAEYGVGIQIDDFGTGYSSMRYLAELPVQALKIDRAFISRLAEQDAQAGVVQAVIAVGHALGLEVIAEGVESDAQLEYLRSNDCDSAQGYLIAKPMPAEQFSEWLAGELRSGKLNRPAGAISRSRS